MRYLALIYGNDDIWNGPDRRDMIAKVNDFNRRLTESGELISVNGLVGPPVTVRPTEDGLPVISDGPYLEVKEHVGSYFMLDVESHERALEIIQSYPGVTSRGGGVELWRLMHQR